MSVIGRLSTQQDLQLASVLFARAAPHILEHVSRKIMGVMTDSALAGYDKNLWALVRAFHVPVV